MALDYNKRDEWYYILKTSTISRISFKKADFQYPKGYKRMAESQVMIGDKNTEIRDFINFDANKDR
ncbi:MAG TPA: hypothetical protein V6D17_23145 [Candidatus Obscuribacterales bacterium]